MLSITRIESYVFKFVATIRGGQIYTSIDKILFQQEEKEERQQTLLKKVK
jgi:hypothetical protein